MSFEDWTRAEDEEDEELQDASIFEGKRDIILFAIDCSESMQEKYEDPKNKGKKTSHLLSALQAAVEIQKRKVLVGPNDAVGILLFNTTRKNESSLRGATEYKHGTYVYQPIAQVDAPKIQELNQTLYEARNDLAWLKYEFPPTSKQTPIGDVFTSCNWALRDGVKSGVKRIFLITDQDDPHPGARNAQLVTVARTTLLDLTQTGVAIEPFFISTEEKSFDASKFYSAVLGGSSDDDDEAEGLLPEEISISRIDDLLEQMRFREMPKRAIFSIPFELADGFTIGIKGYGLVTEQKKGNYKYFVDLGDRLEVVEPKTLYVDEGEQRAVDKTKIMYGMQLGPAPEGAEEEYGVRRVPKRSKVFFTSDEIKSFRTLGLRPGLKLLGFKDDTELRIEDNVKHSTFIFPDEQAYSGSRRTFTALLKSMKKKNKIGLVRAVVRANASPMFCALLPQEEKIDEYGSIVEPAGFHLIAYPFADDLREAPVKESLKADSKAVEAARQWIQKLKIKNGGYPPDANPNPALKFHNDQLQASAFREEYDPDTFVDDTKPNVDMIHERAGKLIKSWKETIDSHEQANTIFVSAGTKRKADVSVGEIEIRDKFESGTLSKLRVDQLKEFLKSKSQPVSGKKDELVERVANYLAVH